MKRILAILLLLAVSFTLAACGGTGSVPDGIYRIEADDYDNQGYRDYVQFEFRGGELVSLSADAMNATGALKSEDEQLTSAMTAISGTYPAKFYADLCNLYLACLDSSEVDIVAGATLSSQQFIKLMQEAEYIASSGDVSGIIVVEGAAAE